jgi:hypothetical protein
VSKDTLAIPDSRIEYLWDNFIKTSFFSMCFHSKVKLLKIYLHEFDLMNVKGGIPDSEPLTDSAHLDLLH